ncbi:MAG: hypothetical protein ABSF11_05085 [Methylocella sp.]
MIKKRNTEEWISQRDSVVASAEIQKRRGERAIPSRINNSDRKRPNPVFCKLGLIGCVTRYRTRKVEDFGGDHLHHLTWLEIEWLIDLFPVVIKNGTNCEVKAGSSNSRLPDEKKRAGSSALQ